MPCRYGKGHQVPVHTTCSLALFAVRPGLPPCRSLAALPRPSCPNRVAPWAEAPPGTPPCPASLPQERPTDWTGPCEDAVGAPAAFTSDPPRPAWSGMGVSFLWLLLLPAVGRAGWAPCFSAVCIENAPPLVQQQCRVKSLSFEQWNDTGLQMRFANSDGVPSNEDDGESLEAGSSSRGHESPEVSQGLGGGCEPRAPSPAMASAVLRRVSGGGSVSYFPFGLSPQLRSWWEGEFGPKDAAISDFQESFGAEMAVAMSKMQPVAREKEVEKVMAKALGLMSLEQAKSLSARNLYSLQLFCHSHAAELRQPPPVSLSDHLVVVLSALCGTDSCTVSLHDLRTKLLPCMIPERLHTLAACTPEYASWALAAYDAWLRTSSRLLIIQGSQGQVRMPCRSLIPPEDCHRPIAGRVPLIPSSPVLPVSHPSSLVSPRPPFPCPPPSLLLLPAPEMALLSHRGSHPSPACLLRAGPPQSVPSTWGERAMQRGIR